MQHSFTCERDTDGYPINMAEPVKEMARLMDRGEWNEDNNEQLINYFRDYLKQDEKKLKWLSETNQYRTEKYDKELKNREFRTAINDFMFIKDLSTKHIEKKIEEFKELHHSIENIEKLEEFKNIVDIADINLRKERINNYIERYL